MKLIAGWATDVGHARAGKTNEDSYLVDDSLALFAVADGMGGHRGGEVASTTAIEALRAAFATNHELPGVAPCAHPPVLVVMNDKRDGARSWSLPPVT